MIEIAIVYTASYCPYCTQAKELLKQKNIFYKEIDVTEKSEREEMTRLSGGRQTVPQIFIKGVHIGGFDDLRAKDKNGELDQILKQAELEKEVIGN